MQVVRIAEFFGPPPWPASLLDGLDAIFWETAGRPPQGDEARAKFRHRWLTSYLATDTQHAFVALAGEGKAPIAITGYLVGTLETPLSNPRFASDGYLEAFADALHRYPAHLHINLTESARGHGVGRALIEAFCAHAANLGTRGVHVVTGAGARNVAFYYGHVGFTEQGRTQHNGRDLVLLGRTLSANH
jgi:GNAT superfamily N-acetyltransferase